MNKHANYHDLATSLTAAGAGAGAGEVHGTLCGLLCVSGDAPPAAVVDIAADAKLQDQILALRDQTLEGLVDPEFGFRPLLPDDDAALDERVQSLAQWCGGFVYGLASQPGFTLIAASSEVQELVHDFTELSKATLPPEGAGGDQGEADYAELVEYLRVGVQLIFLELRTDRADAAGARLH